MKHNKYLLWEGELTDAPGRCESWTEHLVYLGEDRWRLEIAGTDFCGTRKEDLNKEEFSTQKLIQWVSERDSEEKEIEKTRGAVLFDIATRVGCTGYFEIINNERVRGYSLGKTPKILKVIGKGVSSLWIRKTMDVVDVETDQGPGILHSGKENIWTLRLKKGSFAERWRITLDKKNSDKAHLLINKDEP